VPARQRQRAFLQPLALQPAGAAAGAEAEMSDADFRRPAADRDLGIHLDAFGAGFHQQLADDAFVDGFDFHRRLVGFDFGDHVA
jgi:hypothetical protein